MAGKLEKKRAAPAKASPAGRGTAKAPARVPAGSRTAATASGTTGKKAPRGLAATAAAAKTGSAPNPGAPGVYDESKIKTLSSLEHIRLRTGMYIGRLGDGSNPDDGIYVLLKEVIDNGIDEFIMGNGKLIEVAVKDGTAKIRDFGRGIPLGKLVECVSVINTGAKYNDDVFQFSVGLNGVGTKAVNALSSHFRVAAIRNGEFAEAVLNGAASRANGRAG
jgi:topoisomerase-4 subunit B